MSHSRAQRRSTQQQHAPPTVAVSLDRLRQQLATRPTSSSSFPHSNMSGSESSYIIPDVDEHQAPPSLHIHHDDSDDDELDSLPSSLSSGVLSSSEADSADAQREWEESLEQIQLLLTMVLVPWVGKFLGRKVAYWSWARYMEWAHNVEIRWTNKTAANIAGAAEVAATL